MQLWLLSESDLPPKLLKSKRPYGAAKKGVLKEQKKS